jgi:hypothetical protein
MHCEDSTGTRPTLRSINTRPLHKAIIYTAIRNPGADGWQLFYFLFLKCIVMSVLVNRWWYGSTLVSCWFVSPGVFVFASQIGYSVTDSCEPPWG